MTTAAYLAQSLVANDIDTVFGIPSYTFMNGLRAYKEAGLNLTLNTHEQNAAHAAEGYYLATATPAVLSIAMGPGVTNSITGIANAFAENIPMLITIPTAYSHKIGQNEYHSNSGIGQNIDEYNLLKSVTKSVYKITDQSQATHYIDLAIKDLFTDNLGPVVLIIPPEIQKASVDNNQATKLTVPSTHEFVSDQQCQAFEDAWSSAQKPIFMLGKEIRQVNRDSLNSLLTDNAPYFSSYQAGGWVPKLPNYLGNVWYCNSKHIETAVAESDLVIAIGEDFTHFTVRAIEADIRKTQLVHINSSIAELGRVFNHSNNHVANLTAVVEFLSSLGKKPNESHYKSGKPNSSTQKYIRKLAKHLPDNAVFFADVGNAGYTAIAELDLGPEQDFYTSGKFGACGWSIGTSIGYALAQKRVTFSIIGDLSLNMNIQELANIRKLGARSNVILFNNSTPQNISQDQIDEHGMEFQTDCPRINWDGICQAYGLKYHQIHKMAELSSLAELNWEKHQHLIEMKIPKSDRPLDR